MTLTNPKVAIISDLHLGIHSNSTFWHNVALKWANWIKSELTSKGITDIIFCGDWHHNRSEISVNTLHTSACILDILKDFNIIAITGNHDIFFKHRTDVNSLSIFRRKENITVLESVATITQHGRTITFCPWNTNLDEIPRSDVLFGHFEVETFKMNSFKLCEEGMKVKDLLEKSPLVISGHFHIRHEKQYGAGTILYVGNPFQMDFGDAGNTKGYHILDLASMEYEFIENAVSPYYEKLTLSELVLEGSISPRIKRIIKGNIVKLKIDKNICQEDMSTLLSILNRIKPESITVDYDINFNRLLNEDKPREDLSGIDVKQAIIEFINLLDIENKKDVIDYTVELYRKSLG